MKKIILFFLFFLPYFTLAQSANEYQYVVVQQQFPFLSEKNQYNLNELTKFLISKDGLIAFYDSEDKPIEFSFDKCKVLQLDVSQEKAFLSTKLKLSLSDCNGKIVAESTGSSKEKDFRIAYNYALRKAFDQLNIPTKQLTSLSETVKNNTVLKSPDFLYAQQTEYGFSLLDNTDLEQYKLYTSSNGAFFLISGQNKTGILYQNNQSWTFEYISEQKLMTQTLLIKF